MAVSVSDVDLMGRVCQVMNKIYRGVLCIRTHERMTYITMDSLELDLDGHDGVNAFRTLAQDKIVLSWDLLAYIVPVEGEIPSSFTNFITTPELSGPLYISPEIYHAQITEYLL